MLKKVTEVQKAMKELGLDDQAIEVQIQKGLSAETPLYEDDRETGVISDDEFTRILDQVAAGVKSTVTVDFAKSATAVADATKTALDAGKAPTELDELRKRVEVSIQKSEQTQEMLRIFGNGIIDLLKLNVRGVQGLDTSQANRFKEFVAEVSKSLGGVQRQVASASAGPRGIRVVGKTAEQPEETTEDYEDQVLIFKSELFQRMEAESKNPETAGARRQKIGLTSAVVGVPQMRDMVVLKRAAHELGYTDLVAKAPNPPRAVA